MGENYGDGAYGDGAYGPETTSTDTEDEEFGYDTLGFGSGPFGGGSILDDDDPVTQIDPLPETPYFGGGQFGQGLYAYHTEQMVSIRNAWDSGGLSLHPESSIYALLSALAMPLGILSDDLVEIHDAQHINTARNGELGLIGDLADIERQTNETDTRLRARIIAAIRAGVTGTTHEDVLQFLASLLEVDSSRIDMDRTPEQPGVATARINATDLQQATLTQEDVSRLGTKVVPAGHRLEITLQGTFEVESDDYDVPPERSISSDSFEGGTLAGDIT